MEAILFSPEIFLVWTSLAKTIILLGLILGLVSYTVYAERKVSALIQDRVGPNRVGIPLTKIALLGLGQPIADAMKLLLKENFMPNSVNKFYYYIAPKLTMIPPILVLCVLPFGSSLFGVPMVIANINIGILFVFAVTSLGVYGIVLAGWASNSKYSFLGGMRSSSQMISYELSMGLSVVPIFLVIGTLNLPEIVQYQAQHGWLISPYWPQGFSVHSLLQGDWSAVGHSLIAGFSLKRFLLWIPMLISFVVFVIAIFAETNRLPFDLPEAEQELVGGYHTEYSSMGFALFFLGEYAAMISGSGVIVTLFLGGWSFPCIPDGNATTIFGYSLPFLSPISSEHLVSLFWGLVNIGTFFAKICGILLFMIWVRWTLPRFRYDQLMKLGWYVFFELALANIFIAALILMYVK
ncbi:MAG: complex I subunit 1 family protein [Chthoniobacterales bacterium]